MNDKKISEINNKFNSIKKIGYLIIDIIFSILLFVVIFASSNIYELIFMITLWITFFSNLLKKTNKFKKIGKIIFKTSFLTLIIEILICIIYLTSSS